AKRNQLHFDIANLRADHHHKATTQIAKRGGTVKVETLNIDGMKRNRRLARAIGDAGMSEFVRQLEYKCAWYGTTFEKVDRWYPSSKTCSACGAVKQSLLLSERTYRCNRCGFECDRDENAARNLQAYTGHSEPARHLNEFPGPASSAGGEMDVETHRSHRREACARSVKRLPDNPSAIPTGNGGQV
ncbi:MAG: transposase, partial [Caldilineaceae bacterium]|nr:transposase [Caldilineaceae bacterium]